MTVDEADARIAAFRTQSQCATQNLIELAEWPIYKCLRGESGATPLEFSEGSRARVETGLAIVDHLWECIALFNDTLDRAKKIRESIWLLDTEGKLAEIEKILHGPSVSVKSRPTPLERRTLVSAAQAVRRVSLHELLSELVRDFDEAKAVFLAVDSAIHEGASASVTFEKSLRELSAAVSALANEPLRREFAALSDRAAETNRNMQRDPLLFHDALKSLGSELERIKSAVSTIERERANVASELKRAAELVKELRDVNAQCMQAAAECARKIENSGPFAEPVEARVIDDFQLWLDKLSTQFHADFTPLKVALPRFRSKVDDCLKMERSALASRAALLDQWMELNGRLLALRAKSRAMAGRGVAVDSEAERLAANAEAALNRRPASLENAAKCVREYEHRLLRSS